MYIDVTESIFMDAFINYGRKDNFSYEGLQALYEMLTESEDGIGNELDVIAICCDFAEYEEEEAISQYGYLFDDNDVDEDERDFKALIELLQDETLVLVLDNGNIIVQAF